MKRKQTLLLVSLASGLVGVVLRCFSLMTEFDPVTNARDTGAPLYWILIGLSVAVIAFLFISGKSVSSPAETRMPLPRAWLYVETAALVVLLSISALDMLRFFGIGDRPEKGSIATLAFSLLTLLAVASLLAVAMRAFRSRLTPAYGLYLTVPIFWSALHLIMDFRNHAGNPILGSYIFNMAAFIFLTLMLFSSSDAFYNGKSTRNSVLTACCAIYFSLIALLPPVLIRIIGVSSELPRAARPVTRDVLMLTFVILHALASLWMAEKNTLLGVYKEEAKTPPDDIDEAESERMP